MVTTALVRFTASDALVADVHLLKEPLKILEKADGLVKTNIYYAIQKEDQRTGYLVLTWKSYEHHAKFRSEPAYKAFADALKPLYTGSLDVEHVDYDKDAAPVFEAPATEFVTWTTKPETSMEHLLKMLKPLRDKISSEKACHGTALGVIKEKPSALGFVLGWDSVKVHYEIVEGYDIKILNELLAIADLALKHAEPLQKYVPAE